MLEEKLKNKNTLLAIEVLRAKLQEKQREYEAKLNVKNKIVSIDEELKALTHKYKTL